MLPSMSGSYDIDHDVYAYPAGEQLRRYSQERRAAKEQPPVDGLYRYRARETACNGCDLRPRCWLASNPEVRSPSGQRDIRE